MAGMAGFEPAMTESKSVALTIGRHPNAIPLKYAVLTILRIIQVQGWVIGFEPTISSATNWRFNQLSYTHHTARWKGLEPLTYCLEGSCSIQLSYQRTMERVMGIEHTQPAWKASVLPLNYTRISATVIILPQFQKFVKQIFEKIKKIYFDVI